jgi:transcriptional regulator with XRE-family HTH domain
MDFSSTSPDPAVLREIGERIARHRLRRNLTQAELARRAGVSKRTVLRLESGESTQLTNLIRILRALGMLEDLLRAIPTAQASPIEQLQTKGKQRRRASPGSSPQRSGKKNEPWRWGDEEAES